MKLQVLKWYLRLAAAVQVLLWGVTHIFFPEWYLTVIAGKDASLLTPQNVLTVNEIGVTSLAVGTATWLAAKDPVKHYPVIVLIYLAGLGSIGVTLYHILVRRASQEWGHVLTVAVMLALLTALYPWQQARRRADP